MKKQEIAKALTEIDEALVADALAHTAKKPKFYRSAWFRGVAAVLAVGLVAGGLQLSRVPGKADPNQPDVPDHPSQSEAVHGLFPGLTAHAVDLMADYPDTLSTPAADWESKGGGLTDFYVKLFQHSMTTDQNVILSPYSVVNALGMTVNGAGGETKAQMETMLGTSAEALNQYLLGYQTSLPTTDKCVFHSANSIWLREDESLSVSPDFLETNANYYGAAAYAAPFDASTITEINKWVKLHTADLIDKVIDPAEGIDPAAMLYLINALSFDGEWQDIFEARDVRESDFVSISGEKQRVRQMYSKGTIVFDDGQATGFLRPYAGGDYGFVALLPNEGVSLEDYVNSLTGAGLKSMLEHPVEDAQVFYSIPCFTAAYETSLKSCLGSMGMVDAFSPTSADFSQMAACADGNLYVGEVIHKATITVDERGTKAGAVTSVEMRCESAPFSEKLYTIYLERPFLYLIVDLHTMSPLFMGAEVSVN